MKHITYLAEIKILMSIRTIDLIDLPEDIKFIIRNEITIDIVRIVEFFIYLIKMDIKI